MSKSILFKVLLLLFLWHHNFTKWSKYVDRNLNRLFNFFINNLIWQSVQNYFFAEPLKILGGLFLALGPAVCHPLDRLQTKPSHPFYGSAELMLVFKITVSSWQWDSRHYPDLQIFDTHDISRLQPSMIQQFFNLLFLLIQMGGQVLNWSMARCNPSNKLVKCCPNWITINRK